MLKNLWLSLQLGAPMFRRNWSKLWKQFVWQATKREFSFLLVYKFSLVFLSWNGLEEDIVYWVPFSIFFQEQVSESTTTLVLSKLLPDTMYTVTVLPVYAEGDGPQLSQKGKTSKWLPNDISHTEKLYISIWRRFWTHFVNLESTLLLSP